ncbi:hypothetical protein CEXT_377041 [Caerostris extrusa]|uniref:Uncharacterized protein n=1 Tax=Caerostris extrusa TaxID=172846 RepID=A0AAV4W3U7_CAEEX|nr:hypothetical protein CEXT_377041 [Caerostris extrusa]
MTNDSFWCPRSLFVNGGGSFVVLNGQVCLSGREMELGENSSSMDFVRVRAFNILKKCVFNTDFVLQETLKGTVNFDVRADFLLIFVSEIDLDVDVDRQRWDKFTREGKKTERLLSCLLPFHISPGDDRVMCVGGCRFSTE